MANVSSASSSSAAASSPVYLLCLCVCVCLCLCVCLCVCVGRGHSRRKETLASCVLLVFNKKRIRGIPSEYTNTEISLISLIPSNPSITTKYVHTYIQICLITCPSAHVEDIYIYIYTPIDSLIMCRRGVVLVQYNYNLLSF